MDKEQIKNAIEYLQKVDKYLEENIDFQQRCLEATKKSIKDLTEMLNRA